VTGSGRSSTGTVPGASCGATWTPTCLPAPACTAGRQAGVGVEYVKWFCVRGDYDLDDLLLLPVYRQSYDAENRLTGVSGAASATFVYDGDGNRVKAAFGSAVTAYVGSYYEKQGATIRKYYYAGGARVAMREGGTLYYLFTDHLGSTALTLRGSTRVGELRYHPYGGTRYSYGTTPTSYRFTGQREDTTIGLYFYNARYYDAALGRFVQADTIVPSPGDPQSLNRYSYVLNSPLNYRDPSGHAACLDQECNWVENPVTGDIVWRGSGSPPSSALPENLLAPLEPYHPTGLPSAVDWLVQPLLHIWPRVKFYESSVRYSAMLSDIEIECGIKDDARLLTDSPFLVSPSATRVYLPTGNLWMETERAGFLPGKITMGGTSARLGTSYRGVSVQAQSVNRVMMSVTDLPGVLRWGTGVEVPIIAQREGIGSVRKTPYMRVSTNVYGNRAAALVVDIGVPIAAWKLWPALLAGGGASELLRRAGAW